MCSSFSQSLSFFRFLFGFSALWCPVSYLVFRVFDRALCVSFLIFFLYLWWMYFVFKIYICDYLVLTALLSRISSLLCANMDELSLEGIWSDAPFSLPLKHQLLSFGGGMWLLKLRLDPPPFTLACVVCWRI